jgi:hypothetical protein
MPDIIYWGNGGVTAGEYTAPKEVASVAIVQLPGGVEVNWAGGIVDILPGTSATVTPIYSKRVEAWRITVDVFYASGSASGLLFVANQVVNFNSRVFPPAGFQMLYVPVGSNWSSFFYFPNIGRNTTSQPVTYEGISVQTSAPVTTNDTPYNHAIGFYGNRTTKLEFKNLRNLQFVSVVSSGSLSGYRVTTDTGAFTERNITTSPTWSPLTGGCAVAIAYADSSTEQIPLSECYQWARFRDDQDCPEGTCTVDCADHRCCYDPNTGIAVKIIPL